MKFFIDEAGNLVPTRLCEGEGDAGGAGTPEDKGKGGADDPNKGKTFSQEDVNRFLADHKRNLKEQLTKYENDLKAKDQTLEELQASQMEILNTLKTLGGGGDDGKSKPIINTDPNRDLKDIIKDTVGTIQKLAEANETFEEKLGELQSGFEAEQAMREIAEEEALISERDSMLQRALLKNNCLDIKNALKLFEDMVEIDTDTGQWFIVDDENNTEYSLAEGVAKLLPDYMKKPLTQRSGSGSGSPSLDNATDVQRANGRLKELEQQIAGLQVEYKNNPSRNLITKVQTLSRERNKLARDLRMQSV